MKVHYVRFITRGLMRDHPEARFVFGDNLERRGRGGQARVMRDEPNAIGIVTKRKPTMHEDAFFDDNTITDKIALLADLMKVNDALEEGRELYASYYGIGTELAQLPKRAPKLYRMLWEFFDDVTPCPWPRPIP